MPNADPPKQYHTAPKFAKDMRITAKPQTANQPSCLTHCPMTVVLVCVPLGWKYEWESQNVIGGQQSLYNTQTMFDLFELISSPMTFIRETFGLMEESPYIIVNHILQCYFFSLGVSNFIALLLKVISFEYAEQVAESRITMLIGVFLLFYCKIWALESLAMELACYFSLVMVSLYVYDCCGNISHWLSGWQTVRREFALIGAFAAMAGSTLLLLYSVFKSNEVHYPFTGIYLLLLVLISIGHLLRNRTILYALVGALTMNYLIAARCIKWDSALLSSPHLPLTLIPFFMMALDAEKKERKEVDNPLYAAIFRSCLCLGVFSVLYIGSQPLELILGCVFLFGLLINR